MGIGSALSRYLNRGLVYRFVWIELLLGVIGGFSSALLMLAFAFTQGFELILYALVIVMGVLVGLEIPLLMRIVRDRYQFRDVIAHVLTFDYLGALGASLLFPILLVPRLGLGPLRHALWPCQCRCRALEHLSCFPTSSPARGRCAQRASSSYAAWELAWRRPATSPQPPKTTSMPTTSSLLATRATSIIVLTRFKDDLRLFLNSHLQFSSRDEYRYHEALIHPGLAAVPAPRRVLVLGGGDGLAVREILKYPQIESITLVDLDPEMTKLFLYASHAHDAKRQVAPLSASACHQRRRISLGRFERRQL